MRIFGLKNKKQLGPYIKIVSAMRGLTGQAETDIAIPIIRGYLEVMGVENPDSDVGRQVGAEFADSIALLLADATTMIFQEMQRQQTSANNLTMGRADKLLMK